MSRIVAPSVVAVSLAWAGLAGAATPLNLETSDGVQYRRLGAPLTIPESGRTYEAVLIFEGLDLTSGEFLFTGTRDQHWWDPWLGNGGAEDGNSYPAFDACTTGDGCLKIISPGVARGTIRFAADYSYNCGPGTPFLTICDIRYDWGYPGTMLDVYFTRNSSGAAPSAWYSFAAIPEPATWAMMIIGFGAVGAALRARRLRPTVASAA